VQKSASKLMATVLWDCDGILLIDYLAKGSTINALFFFVLARRGLRTATDKAGKRLKNWNMGSNGILKDRISLFRI
jgi:hypothetical protein